MDENELGLIQLDRLLNLLTLQIGLIEHSIVRDDLYTKDDILKAIKELYIISSVIKIKINKKNAKTK